MRYHYCNKCMRFTETVDNDCKVCGLSKTNTNLDMEYIKHASTKSKCGNWIIIAKCHGDCFHKAHHMHIKLEQSGQGFVTNKGRHVDRTEGAKIAIEAGQVKPPNDFLFSEDLWHPDHGGRFKYCDVKGYIEQEEKLDSEE